MPTNNEWQVRIKAVEREFLTTRLAIAPLTDDSRRDPSVLEGDMKPKDVVAAAQNVESTYLVRLFAEFESGLRQYWQTLSDTVPKTKDLLDGLGARCRASEEVRERAQLVREYRNSLVHERSGERFEAVGLDTARANCCAFFSHLPREWEAD